jgi:hypothetical protein
MQKSIHSLTGIGWISVCISTLLWSSNSYGVQGVAAWGDNSLGEMNIPAGLTGVQAVAAGGYPGNSGHCLGHQRRHPTTILPGPSMVNFTGFLARQYSVSQFISLNSFS